jgi:hypothetical protein
MPLTFHLYPAAIAIFEAPWSRNESSHGGRNCAICSNQLRLQMRSDKEAQSLEIVLSHRTCLIHRVSKCLKFLSASNNRRYPGGSSNGKHREDHFLLARIAWSLPRGHFSFPDCCFCSNWHLWLHVLTDLSRLRKYILPLCRLFSWLWLLCLLVIQGMSRFQRPNEVLFGSPF